MDCLQVLPETLEVLKNHRVEREKLIFGHVDPPIMVECDYKDGSWGIPQLVPYHNLSLDPATKVFHYAQGIFEGMKAYNVDNNGPLLFRTEDNYARFINSSKRLDIPEIPKEYFMDGVDGLTRYCIPYIPTESRYSLYLRPFIIATENGLGANTSQEFKFIIIGKVSKPYIDEYDSVPVLIEREYGRVGRGCTGSAKAISNYASGMLIDRKAKEKGYLISLWLDSSEGRYIEELSGMNFFCVIEDIIYTPKLNDSILPGITRESIIKLCKDMNYQIQETDIEINELTLMHWEECSEMFACGTTATVMPVAYLGDSDGKKYYPHLSIGPITERLQKELLSLQEGRSFDPYGWVRKLD